MITAITRGLDYLVNDKALGPKQRDHLVRLGLDRVTLSNSFIGALDCIAALVSEVWAKEKSSKKIKVEFPRSFRSWKH